MMLLAIDRIPEIFPLPQPTGGSPKHFIYGMSPPRAYARWPTFTSKIFHWRFLYEIEFVNPPCKVFRDIQITLNKGAVNCQLCIRR